jgi:Arc/MetJ-type ribon-helix-helix transcriptional regulator
MTTKMSVSVPDEDAAFIDVLARERGGSRSAVIHDLVRLGREMRAAGTYSQAFDEWQKYGESDAWDPTAPDGLND